MALKINTQAPDFSLQSTSGAIFKLSVDKKNAPVVIYFYPKDFTSGCTTEACEFRNAFDIFKNVSVDVIGISKDTIETHQKYRKEHNLPFHLLADLDGKVAKLYDALMPIIGLTQRVTYLLDKNHKIVAVYDDLFGAEKHIQKMIKNLGKV